MDLDEKILGLIRIKGPVMPSQINKEIGTSILITSATLGDLASKNRLKISYLKIGGTPLYYIEGQELRLQQFAHKLHEQEKKAYDLVRQRIVLRDRELTPVTRVALREIRDFAKPLQVNNQGETEIFWKWYLISNDDALKYIKEILGAEKKAEPKEPAEEIKKEAEERAVKEEIGEPERPRHIEHAHRAIEQQKTLRPVEKKELKIKKAVKKDAEGDYFLKKIEKYFSSNDVEVIEQSILRKGADMEFVIKVPSAVGPLTYFCKARSKRKINEGDLSAVYFQAQSRKLPVLFLTIGELTKKAQSMLENEFKGMNVKKI